MLNILLLLLVAYGGVGFLFALYFAFRGALRLDPAVEGSPIGFRLLIIPGTIVLWPLLLAKLQSMQGAKA